MTLSCYEITKEDGYSS